MRTGRQLHTKAASSMHLLVEQRIAGAKKLRSDYIFWMLASWFAAGLLAFLLQRSVTKDAQKVFKQLKIVAGQLKKHSTSLDAAAKTSAAATSQEAAAIQESVAALAQMTSMLTQTADLTDATDHLASESLDITKRGSQTMQNMSNAMNEITHTNSKLSSIASIISDIANRTGIINDIVFKTQLLAVNAGIEAARAGAHGKGFAVVANEVSNLAAVSGKAASEIGGLLDKSKEQVNSIVANTAESIELGLKVSEEAIDSFQKVAGALDTISYKVKQIAEASSEQKTGISQTTRAMDELNKTTSVNSSAAQENAHLSTVITGLGRQLEHIELALSLVLTGKAPSLHPASRPTLVEKESHLVNKSSKQSKHVDFHTSHPIGPSQAKIQVHQAKVHSFTSSSAKPSTGKFAWQPGYDIGVEDMNNEHKHLLGLMSKLHDDYLGKRSFTTQLQTLEELLSYTIKHFSDEERYFDSIGFPEAESHKGIHKNLLDKLSHFADNFKKTGELNEEFFAFLKTWLSAHIQGVDIRYGNFSKTLAA